MKRRPALEVWSLPRFSTRDRVKTNGKKSARASGALHSHTTLGARLLSWYVDKAAEEEVVDSAILLCIIYSLDAYSVRASSCPS